MKYFAMSRGKNICKQLKEVRKRIAEENDIPLEIKECTYHGECRGTCPRCEAEVRYLENALADRIRLGKVATIAGLTLGLSACGNGGGSGTSFGALEGEVPNSDTLEEVDTLRQTAEKRDSVWREPSAPPDIVAGGDFVLKEPADTISDEPLMGVLVECDPEFPGGMEALYKFIEDNMKYPQLAAENGIGGRVYVQFEVDTDGTVLNPRVLRDIGAGCGKEALRIVRLMPKWIPGKQRNPETKKYEPARITFNLPIKFDIEKYRNSPEYVPLIEGKAPIIEEKIPIIELDKATVGAVQPTVDLQRGKVEYQQETDRTTIIVK